MRYFTHQPLEIERDLFGCFAIAVIFLALLYLPVLLMS